MKQSFSAYMKKIIIEDRDPLGIIINDKIRVKEYVDERLGKNELFDHRIYTGYDIDECLKAIKKPCVIRANNGWHRMRFLIDATDILNRSELVAWQTTKTASEAWSYKQIRPGFSIEKLLPVVHTVIRFFVFYGRVEYIWRAVYTVATKRIGVISTTMYDREWNQLPVMWNKVKTEICEKPARLDEMIKISEKLYSNAWKFMRVDLYYIDDKILLSELTQLHAAGTNGFGDFDYVLGRCYEY